MIGLVLEVVEWVVVGGMDHTTAHFSREMGNVMCAVTWLNLVLFIHTILEENMQSMEEMSTYLPPRRKSTGGLCTAVRTQPASCFTLGVPLMFVQGRPALRKHVWTRTVQILGCINTFSLDVQPSMGISLTWGGHCLTMWIPLLSSWIGLVM